MKSVYRRELRSLFCNLTGELFMALMLCVTGIYCSIMAFSGGYTSFEIVLSNTDFLLLILIPLFTMRAFSEERRQGTDKLLHSLPLRVTHVVLGKYFAFVTVLAGVYILYCGYPLLFSIYGTVDFATAYSAIFGSFLTGCALIALGMFCSAMTDNPVLSAVFSFALTLLAYLAPQIGSYVSASGFAAFVLFTFAIVLLIILLRFLLKNIWIPIAAGCILEIPLIAILLLDYTLLDGAVQSVLNAVSLFSRLDSFVYGIFDLEAVVYLLSAVFLFVFFTVLRLENHPRAGWYHTALTLLAVICIAAANLLISALPADMTRIDTTRDSVFTLSEGSVSFLKELDEDVTVYLLAGTGNEDEGIVELADKMQSCSDRIHLELRDPVLYPLFSRDYTALSLSENSLIIDGSKRSTVVDYSEIYVYDSENNLIFDGEASIVNALRYVTTDELPALYLLTGHGELTLTDDLTSVINTDGFDVRSLNLLSATGIPEDASLIAIMSPTADITEPELAILQDYLSHGGGILICEDMLPVSTPNLDALLEGCGLCAQKGLIVEGDSDRYLSGYPTYLLPIFGSHEITDLYAELSAQSVMPVTQSVTQTAVPNERWSYTALLKTSESAYLKEDPLTVTDLSREAGDISGCYALAVAGEDSVTDGKIVWFGSSLGLDAGINELTSGTNHGLFASSCQWLSGSDAELSIPAKSLALQVMVMSEEEALFWNAVCVYILPILITAVGVLIWSRRRFAKRRHRK